MKKLVAIDLDGTLLSSNLDISKRNITAIQKAQQQGHIIMICSGRAPEDIKEVLKDTPIECPIAGSNGTIIEANGSRLLEVSIDNQSVKNVAAILNENHFPFKVYTNKGIFVEANFTERMKVLLDENEDIRKHFSARQIKLMTEQPKETEMLKFFESIDHILQLENISVQKFFIATFVGKEALISLLKEKVENIVITTSGPYNIEIMDTNGNKGNALKLMAEHYNVPIENTIAIGDNFNDLPMLEQSGFSIAMENGDPTIKERASAVTTANDEDGVATAIEKYVFD
ncbi:hypothetical protein BKP35_05410 [Anaerobacillus arseniciselenatis]|uniref:Hydrolase n=1 Tax=Anaerobacillus arseniciselenatis TaxID=85682 RepID=A0A1S2LV92_9BACI|nr:Cof-type HAD-IIB family hydrolase [Anaerobacillus arseniciselenatis]OIJ15285.1 hypothetical protein BKP35_05410 [Anaerobacillus arseniciselenatis]